MIGENRTIQGPEASLRSREGLLLADSPECRDLMEKSIGENPELWNEDIDA